AQSIQLSVDCGCAGGSRCHFGSAPESTQGGSAEFPLRSGTERKAIRRLPPEPAGVAHASAEAIPGRAGVSRPGAGEVRQWGCGTDRIDTCPRAWSVKACGWATCVALAHYRWNA